MKKIYYLLLLLFVVTTATSAKDVKTYNKTYKEAAVASHKTMKKNLVEGKHIPSQIKRLKNNGKSFSKPKYTYEIVFTDSAVQANKTNSKGKIKIEAQKFAFEGKFLLLRCCSLLSWLLLNVLGIMDVKLLNFFSWFDSL